MKCVICNSPDIKVKKVQEEIKQQSDIVLVPLEVLVCHNCGERYYDRKTTKKIEESEIELTSVIDLSEDFLSEEEVSYYMNLDDKSGQVPKTTD